MILRQTSHHPNYKAIRYDFHDRSKLCEKKVVKNLFMEQLKITLPWYGVDVAQSVMYILQSPAPPLINKDDLLVVSSRKHKSRTVPSCIKSSVCLIKLNIRYRFRAQQQLHTTKVNFIPHVPPIASAHHYIALVSQFYHSIPLQWVGRLETRPCNKSTPCGAWCA